MIDKMSPETIGVLMAMLMAILRVIYDKEETKPVRVFIESLLCGALTFTANSGISAMGLDPDWSIFIGGTIGFFGSVAVRSIAIKFIRNKTKK